MTFTAIMSYSFEKYPLCSMQVLYIKIYSVKTCEVRLSVRANNMYYAPRKIIF